MTNVWETDTPYELDLPEKPLEGDLYLGKSCQGYLDYPFIERLHNALTFSEGDKPPIYNAQGRNYYIPLPEPQAAFDSLQVAGGGNADLGIRSTDQAPTGLVVLRHDAPKIITPPSEEPESFSSSTTYFEDGEFLHRDNINPLGSYSSISARRKIEATKSAAAQFNEGPLGPITPKYIGKFEYAIPDQNGERQVAILLLVPSMGRRLDVSLSLPHAVAMSCQIQGGISGPEARINGLYTKIIGPKLFSVGQGLAEVHAAGINHNQPTAGNVDALALADGGWVPYITDWDTMTRPAAEDAGYARAIDLGVLLNSCSSMLLDLVKNEAIKTDIAVELLGFTALQVIGGYSSKGIDRIGSCMLIGEVMSIVDPLVPAEEKIDIIQKWLA